MSQEAAEPFAAPAQQKRQDLTCPWWAVGVLAAAFAALALVTRGGNTLDIDLDITLWVQEWDGSLAAWVADLGNFLGEKVLAIGLVVVAGVGLAVTKQWRDLWFVLFVALGRLLALPLKGVLESPRPNGDQVDVTLAFDHYGFPSGHALTATLSLGAIAFLVARRTERRDVRILLLAMWAFGVSLTAYARIWVGAHWFTDTLGGAILGVVIILTAANLSAMVATPTSIESTWRRR